jgi:predicted glycoside hydrolase/deacetylase ChbG (UPF0249 family)
MSLFIFSIQHGGMVARRERQHGCRDMNATRILVVNADDLGYSSLVNTSIFDLMELGQLTSATVLVNAPAFKEAAQEQRRFPECSFGVHLNCTEFHPLTQHRGLFPLLSDDGQFVVSPRRVRPTPQLLSGIFAEWSAQIDRALSHGIRVSHIDSHHHTHTCIPLFPVLKAIQKKYSIRIVRKSLNTYASHFRVSRQQLLRKGLWNAALARVLSTHVTDVFLSLQTLMEAGSESPWHFHTAEVMTHPGAENDVDTPILKSDWKARLPFPVKLVSYDKLAQAA